MRNEYEVTVTPDGEWIIYHIRDERITRVAYGNVQEEMPYAYDTSTWMVRAERAAREWITEQRAKKRLEQERLRGNKTFTVQI